MTWLKELFVSKLTKEQKAKLSEVDAAYKEVREAVKDLLAKDKRVMELDALEILLGSATVTYEQKVQKAFDTFMTTGTVPPGPIGETIKKQAHKLQNIAESMLPKTTNLSNPRGLKLDLTSAEKDFDNDSEMPTKKLVH